MEKVRLYQITSAFPAIMEEEEMTPDLKNKL